MDNPSKISFFPVKIKKPFTKRWQIIKNNPVNLLSFNFIFDILGFFSFKNNNKEPKIETKAIIKYLK